MNLPCRLVAFLQLLLLPLALNADPESLRPTVGRILEAHGIVGNATLERHLAEGTQLATANSNLATTVESQDTGGSTSGPDDGRELSEEKPTILGLILRFSDRALAQVADANLPPPDAVLNDLARDSWITLEYKRPMSMGRFVFTFPQPIGNDEYQELEKTLLELPYVDSVQPETLAYANFLPNDPFFPLQWNLLGSGDFSGMLGSQVIGINAVGAWSLIGQDMGQIPVAVIDTGMTNPLPLASARVLPGYDFISDPDRARDGDGRDPNPFDNGDFNGANECGPDSEASNSSWHGSSMASLIAATGNDGSGIAGVDWNALIVPVRVLGRCGGTISDIVDGMLWAAGLPVPGVPENENPARILNMSLGGPSDTGCLSLYQMALDAMKSRDVVVVVSAGNDGEDTAYRSLASCVGTLTVGAVSRQGERAGYSNWSDQGQVAISAPSSDWNRFTDIGGLVAVRDSGTTTPTGVLVPGWTGGTSAATALVSGSLSLAMRLDPLQHTDLLVAIMLETAQPFAVGSECDREYPRCGVGILDLEALVQGALVFQNYAVVRDFYHEELNHYFRSGNWDEVSLVLDGQFGHWDELEDKFLAWRDGSAIATHPVCRFYGTPGIGPNSHFYTVDNNECEFIKQNDPGWTYEGTAFYAKKPGFSGNCPGSTKRLYRYYNQRAHFNDSNHRYTTTLADRQGMEAKGWVMEGVAMCVPN